VITECRVGVAFGGKWGWSESCDS